MTKSHKVRFLSKLALLTGTALLALALSSLAHAQQRFNTPRLPSNLWLLPREAETAGRSCRYLVRAHRSSSSSGDPVEDDNVKKEFLTPMMPSIGSFQRAANHRFW